MLPGGKDAGRFKGLPYRAARTEAYMRDNTLVAVEMPLNGGWVDIVRTGNRLVDPKAWKQDTWNLLDPEERQKRVKSLEGQIIRYLTATTPTPYTLVLEFEYFIPAEVQAMLDTLPPSCVGRVTAMVQP